MKNVHNPCQKILLEFHWILMDSNRILLDSYNPIGQSDLF